MYLLSIMYCLYLVLINEEKNHQLSQLINLGSLGGWEPFLSCSCSRSCSCSSSSCSTSLSPPCSCLMCTASSSTLLTTAVFSRLFLPTPAFSTSSSLSSYSYLIRTTPSSFFSSPASFFGSSLLFPLPLCLSFSFSSPGHNPLPPPTTHAPHLLPTGKQTVCPHPTNKAFNSPHLSLGSHACSASRVSSGVRVSSPPFPLLPPTQPSRLLMRWTCASTPMPAVMPQAASRVR